MTSTRPLETDARYVLLSPYAEGRRVLELGCGDGRGLVQLVEAGAVELVATAAKPNEARATLVEAEIDGVDILPDFRPPLSFDDASFDLIICHDLPDRLQEHGEWYRELRRLLDPGGYLALAVAADEGGQYLSEVAGLRGHSPLGYEEIYERFSEDFGDVVIFGQSPVVASLFYDFQSEEEDPGLTLDGSLLSEDGEDPGWYVMVFGQEIEGRDDLLFVRQDFGRVVDTVRGGRAPAPMPTPPRMSDEELDAMRRDMDLAQEEAGEAAELRDLWGHAERTLQTQEQALRDERLRAERAVDDLNRALLEVARLQANLDATSGLHANLSFARQTVEQQEETVRRFEDQKAALGDELRNRGEALGQLEAMLETSQKLLADEGDKLRQASSAARNAEEQLAILRLESYQAQNDLQKLRDDWGKERKRLEGELENAFGNREMTDTRLAEANEHRQAAEREVGEQRDKIAELEKNLMAAEQMFERTKAELIKIEQGAEERIEENKALTEALMQQSAMAAEAKLAERIAELEAEKNAGIEEARAGVESELEQVEAQARAKLEDVRTAAAEREKQLEQEHDEYLAEALNEAAAEAETQLEEVRAAAEGRERSLTEQLESNLEQARREGEERAEQVKGELAAAAEQRETQIREEVQAQVKSELEAKHAQELEHRLQEARDEGESRAQAAESRAQEQEGRLQETVARAEAAEARLKEAEARSQEAAVRAEEAEARTKETAVRAEEAEARATETEARVQEAEARAQEAEARAQEADASAEAQLVEHREQTDQHLAALETDAAGKLETAQTEAAARIAEVEERVAQAIEAKQKLEEELEHANMRARSAEEAKTLAEQDIMAYLQRLKDSEERARHAEEAQVEAVDRIKGEAKQKIAAAKEKVRNATEAREAVQNELEALLTELNEAKEVTQRLEGEAVSKLQLATAQSLIQDLEADLRALREERDALALEVQTLTDAAQQEDAVPALGEEGEGDFTADQTVIDGSVLAMLQKRDKEEAEKKEREKDAVGRDIDAGPEELEDLSSDS